MTRLTSCPDAATVARRAATHVTHALERARAERGVAHLALSGGTTPGLTYRMLGEAPEELEDVHLWFADERCVAPEDEQSNYRLVSETLIEPARLHPERMHRMLGELGPQEGARSYAAELRAAVPGADGSAAGAGDVPVLDLVVLGIGPDGHVASLFPGAGSLTEPSPSACLGVEDSPKPPPERITVSLPVLREARACLLLATGAGKSDAVAAMLGEPTPHVPASLLRRERLTVIVDDAAAPPGPLR